MIIPKVLHLSHFDRASSHLAEHPPIPYISCNPTSLCRTLSKTLGIEVPMPGIVVAVKVSVVAASGGRGHVIVKLKVQGTCNDFSHGQQDPKKSLPVPVSTIIRHSPGAISLRSTCTPNVASSHSTEQPKGIGFLLVLSCLLNRVLPYLSCFICEHAAQVTSEICRVCAVRGQCMSRPFAESLVESLQRRFVAKWEAQGDLY